MSLTLRMHILKKPIRRNLTADMRLARPSQHLAPHRGKLQAESDVVAKTTDCVVLGSAGVLPIDQLRNRRQVPDRCILARQRMGPAFGDIWNLLPLDADR